jgi:hypothetical protein
MSVFASSTIGDLAIRVLLIRPDIGNGRTWTVSHRFDTIIGEGRTTIEERYPARSALLLTQRCTVVARGDAQVRAWREGLAALGPTLVAMPLWIDALPVARWNERIYQPQQVINFTPSTGEFEIYAADDLPGSPAYSHYAPLLVGRWEKRPPASMLKRTLAEFEVKLVEASPWSCRIGINTQSGGWTALPDWKTPPRDISEYSLEQLLMENVAAREAGIDGSNAAARWLQEGEFVFGSRLLIRQHLTWFEAKRGAWESWAELPAWFDTGSPTTGTPSTYTARFASDVLSLEYANGAIAKARVGFIQEIDTGERSQARAAEAYLYRLDYEHDTGNPELLTNWDAPVSGAEGDFEPHQLKHQEIVRSLKPQNVRAELSMVFQAGSLMDDWQRGRLFGAVTLSIWKCNPDDVAATRTMIFKGDVTNLLPDGNSLRVTAKLFGNLFDARMPGWEYGPDCGTHLFSAECGLVEADHDSSGTAAPADLSADGMTLTVHSVTGFGGPTYAAEWFAHGIVKTGTGRNTQEATIMSSALVSGNVVLELARPLWADLIADAGQSVTLLPGCGLQYEADCGTKFDNQDNFRGNPFIPDYLESVDPGQPKTPKK